MQATITETFRAIYVRFPGLTGHAVKEALLAAGLRWLPDSRGGRRFGTIKSASTMRERKRRMPRGNVVKKAQKDQGTCSCGKEIRAGEWRGKEEAE